MVFSAIIVQRLRMSEDQQREIQFGLYKQNVKRRELLEEESSGLFSSYTDPGRNISVGNTKEAFRTNLFSG